MAVERFDVKTCMMSEKKGEYVSYKDYEALELKYKEALTKLERLEDFTSRL
jgi:hypothetical protein